MIRICYLSIYLTGKCVNINANKTDSEGYDCHEYAKNARCGEYDDDDFDSFKMCCYCGGGRLGNYFIGSATRYFKLILLDKLILRNAK